MLGFIMDGSDTLVFEFRDDSGLIDCLSDFGDTRDANVIVIADTSDRVVATIANRDTDDRLDDLREDTTYKLYGQNAYGLSLLPNKGDLISDLGYTFSGIPFVKSEVRHPRRVSEFSRV